MKTELGRVVYDRERHFLDEAAIVRMIQAMNFEKTPGSGAKIFAKIFVKLLFEEKADLIDVTVIYREMWIAVAKFYRMSLLAWLAWLGSMIVQFIQWVKDQEREKSI